MEGMTIYKAAELLEMSAVTFRRRLDYYDIFCFDEDMVNEWIKQKGETEEISSVISEIYYEITGVSVKKGYVKKLVVIASGNNYFGARYIEKPIFQEESFTHRMIYVYKNDIYLLREGLYETIFFHYAGPDEKFEYLMRQPGLLDKRETMRYLRQFYDRYKNDARQILEVANYFRYKLPKELLEMTNQEVSDLIKQASKDISGPALKKLTEFYEQLRSKYKTVATVSISYDKHQMEKKNSQEILPYDMQTYYSVAYMVFNSKYWEENQMIEKAVKSEINAKVWMYHAMHFISAWRSVDIRSKLPRFELNEDPNIVLSKIQAQEYSETEYTLIAEKLFYRLKYQNAKPQKIEKNSSAQPLRFNIAESVKPVMGMLALLCEAHNEINHKDCSLCSVRPLDAVIAKRLFGEDYNKVLGGKMFLNRRANKTFLNTLSWGAEKEGIDGYMIAAYARSHTGGLNRVPEVTSRYLQAKMDGYTPDEIVKCLMERGVCSFVPYLLCKVLDGDAFKEKRITEQTQDMHSLHMSPAKIEGLLASEEKLHGICKKQVQNIIKWVNKDNLKEIAEAVLENIINGECCGKEEDMFCLAKACYQRCQYPQREHCRGCGYEMYTKSLFIELSQEISYQEKALDRARTEGERIKRTAILEERLYPAGYEMLLALKEIYNVDIKEYKMILMRRDQYGIIGDI